MRQLWEVADFVRNIRRRLRFGEFSRAPLHLLRFELRNEIVQTVEFDWMARPADAWDSTLQRKVQEEHESLQALADAIAVRVAARLNQSEQPRLLSVAQAAGYIGRTEKALRHMIGSGAIPAVREGSRIHLDRADLDVWIQMRKTKS